MSEFYNLKTKLPGDKEYDFEQLKGKVVLVVNVASKCGFTPQYKGYPASSSPGKGGGLTSIIT